MAGTTGRRWKCRSRPCSECGRWFVPDARTAKRQVTCGEKCRRARHQRACRTWREANSADEREDRLRQRLRSPGPTGGPGRMEPGAQIQWEVVRDEMGSQASVIIQETAQVLVSWVRDEMMSQTREK